LASQNIPKYKQSRRIFNPTHTRPDKSEIYEKEKTTSTGPHAAPWQRENAETAV